MLKPDDAGEFLRDAMQTWCKSSGYQPVPKRKGFSGIGWYQPIDTGYFAFKMAVGSIWDEVTGGGISVQFNATDDINPRGYKPHDLTTGLAEFLTPIELESLRVSQNEIIGRIKIPDQVNSADRPRMEQRSQPLKEAPVLREHMRFRFLSESDLQFAVDYLVELVPRAFDWLETQWYEQRPNAVRVPVEFEIEGYPPWQSIVDAPDDDMPRLVYADWLDEAGDSRGEFIRIQCQLAQHDVPDYDKKLERRAKELLQQNRRKWTMEFEDLSFSEPVFERGFLERVTMTEKQFMESGEQLVEHVPLLRCLHLSHFSKKLLSLRDFPAFEKLRGLEIDRGYGKTSIVQIERWVKFFLNNFWNKLTRLTMDTDFFMSELHGSATFVENLTHLSLSGGDDLTEFFDSPKIRNLRYLRLSVDAKRKVAGQIAACPHLGQLEELDLSWNSLRNRDVATIVNSKSLPNLKALNVCHNNLTSKVAVEFQNASLPSLQKIQVGPEDLIHHKNILTKSQLDQLRERYPNVT